MFVIRHQEQKESIQNYFETVFTNSWLNPDSDQRRNPIEDALEKSRPVLRTIFASIECEVTKQKILNQVFSLLVDSYFDRWIVAANHHFKDKELGLFSSKGSETTQNLNEKYFTLTTLAKEKKARIKSIEFDAVINEETKLKMFHERVTYDIEKFYVSYAESECEGFYIH